MNSSPSGGEDLHTVQRGESSPRLRASTNAEESATNVPAGPPDNGSPSAGSGRFTFVASLLLIALAFSIGLSYFFEKRWVNRAASSPRNSASETTLVESSNRAAPGALGPDTFRVSAISLDGQRLAIVNGKPVSEGDSLVVATSSGPMTVRVTKIEERVVHFLAGGETIDAQVNPTAGQSPVP